MSALSWLLSFLVGFGVSACVLVGLALGVLLLAWVNIPHPHPGWVLVGIGTAMFAWWACYGRYL